MDQNSWMIIGGITIAALNAYTAYLARETHEEAKATKDIALQTEKNTNSMKDALVAATRSAAHSEGVEAGRAEGKTDIAVLSEKLDAAKK